MTGSPTAAGNYPGSPFVGRETELAALREALASALRGHGRIVLVTGEPGIGKTRTSEEILTVAREGGAEVLWGRCQEWEGAPAYWPWLQILRRYVERTPEETIQANLTGIAGDLAQIMPELERFADTAQSGPAASPEQRRFRLFDAMSRLLRVVSQRQPLVLVLDDLHWADQPSLRLLEFIAQDVHELPLLLIATYRNVELDRQHPLTGTLAELSRDPASRRIILHGLDSDAVSRYIELTSDQEPPPGLVEAVLEETEGNPFFMTEVVGWLQNEGRLSEGSANDTWTIRIPESVREAIGNRLDRLSPETNEILTVAAVIGREFQLQLLARATGIETLELLDRLDEAVQAGVLDELDQPGDYRFSHALIQETLYNELTTSRRLRLHSTVGTALEALHANDLAPHYAELAHHFSESALAGNADKAIDYATKAGDQAMESVAWESAVRFRARALDLLDALPDGNDKTVLCDLQLALAEAFWMSGDAEQGRSTALAAANTARETNDGYRLARAAQAYSGGDRILVLNPNQIAAELIEEALGHLSDRNDRLRADLLARWVRFSGFSPDTNHLRRQRAAKAVAIASRLDHTQSLVHALSAERIALVAGEDCFRSDVVNRRLELSQRLEQLASDVDFGHVSWFGTTAIERMLLGTVSLAELDEYWQELDARIQSAHIPGDLLFISIFRIMLEAMTGNYQAALQLARQAYPHAYRAASKPETHSFIGQSLFAIYREQAELTGFIDEIDRFIDDPGWELYWRIRLILARFEVDDVEQARQEFERFAVDEFASLPPDWNWLENVATLGEIAHLFDDIERAAVLYEFLIHYKTYNAVMIFSWDFIGAVAYYLGLLATTLERWDDAKEHFQFALERHEYMQLPPYIANTQHQHAAMLVKRGDAEDISRARELNQQALAAALEMGMVRLERLATALAEKIDERGSVVVSADGAPYDLTPRELEVLACLVRGSTDREIADDLSISHRTVQVHVSNILGKLEAGSRTAAAALAIREGLV